MRYTKLLTAIEGLIFGISMFFFRLDKDGGPEGYNSQNVYGQEAQLYHNSVNYPENRNLLFSDLLGFLSVDGTAVDYPVMRDRTSSEGNYYYLTHNFRGEPDRSGCPFVRQSQDLDDDIITIFAHNNSNGTMFADLEKFEDESFFNEYGSVVFDTLEGHREYSVIALLDVAVYGGDFSFWGWENFPCEEDELFFIEQIMSLSKYRISEELQPGNSYLMLVTCEYSHDNGRRIVVAVRTA